jgi:hypothetical protein
MKPNGKDRIANCLMMRKKSKKPASIWNDGRVRKWGDQKPK